MFHKSSHNHLLKMISYPVGDLCPLNIHYIVIRYSQQMVQMACVTCRIHITDRLPMFPQHAFTILLWGILMSSNSKEEKLSCNFLKIQVQANLDIHNESNLSSCIVWNQLYLLVLATFKDIKACELGMSRTSCRTLDFKNILAFHLLEIPSSRLNQRR